MVETENVMNFSVMVQVSFAAFAFVYLIRYTDGPFEIFLTFRRRLGIWQYKVEDSDEIIEEIADTFIAKLFSCFWCLATWVVLILMLIMGELDIIGWFACIGLSGFLHELIVRDDGQV